MEESRLTSSAYNMDVDDDDDFDDEEEDNQTIPTLMRRHHRDGKKVCLGCGEKSGLRSKICATCGEYFPKKQNKALTVKINLKSSTEGPKEKKHHRDGKKVCASCGSKTGLRSKICLTCGAEYLIKHKRRGYSPENEKNMTPADLKDNILERAAQLSAHGYNIMLVIHHESQHKHYVESIGTPGPAQGFLSTSARKKIEQAFKTYVKDNQ